MKMYKIALLIMCLLGSYTQVQAIKQYIAAGLLGALPMTGGGIYYYKKNTEINGFKETNIFKGYLEGVIIGIMPIYNFVEGLMYAIDGFCDWLYDDPISNSQKDKAYKIGLVGGLSLYVTVPMAYAALNRLKKAR